MLLYHLMASLAIEYKCLGVNVCLTAENVVNWKMGPVSLAVLKDCFVWSALREKLELSTEHKS